MKDNKKIPVIPDFVSGFNISQQNDAFGAGPTGPPGDPTSRAFPSGLFTAETLLDVRFNEYVPGSADVRSWVKNRAPSTGFEIGNTQDIAVVEGIPDSSGTWRTKDGHLVDADIYGRTVYSKENIYGNNIKDIVPYIQRAVPLGNNALGQRSFLVKEKARALDPYHYKKNTIGNSSFQYALTEGLSYIFKFKLESGELTTNKSIFTIALPSSTASMCIYRSGTTLAANWFKSASAGATASYSRSSLPTGVWITAIVWFRTYAGSGQTTRIEIETFRVSDGAEVGSGDPGSHSDGQFPILLGSTPNLYIGVGEASSGVNPDFDLNDFVDGVQLADLVISKGLPHPAGIKTINHLPGNHRAVGLTEYKSVVTQIARAHLPAMNYTSGFNSLPPRRTQNILEARQTYPKQSFGVKSTQPQTPFNDTSTPIFETLPCVTTSPWSAQPGVMFPEMIPAVQFSGSLNYHTADYAFSQERRTEVLRDVNRTPFKERLVAPGAIRPGLEHEATALLNKWNTSTNTISQNTDILGGTIEPFDDSRIPTDAAIINARAVVEGILPGFDHQRGDLIAIVIPLDPVKDTTIGIDRNNPDRINTSMAYYNFAGSAWETSGSYQTTVFNPAPGGNESGVLTDFSWVIPGISGSAIPTMKGYNTIFNYTFKNWGEVETGFGADASGNVWISNSSSIGSGFNQPGVDAPWGWTDEDGLPDYDAAVWGSSNVYTTNDLAVAISMQQNAAAFIQASASLGFGGTSGFTIYPDAEEDCLITLASRARPTGQCGFPLDDKYEAKSGQLLDMSKYIDGPFLLERFAVHFDAEIEDSGPYSLGYKQRDDRNNEAFTGIFDDKTAFAGDSTLESKDIGRANTGATYSSTVSPHYGSGLGQNAGRTTFNRGQILGGNHQETNTKRSSHYGVTCLLDNFPICYTSASHAPTIFGAVIGNSGFGGPNSRGEYSPGSTNDVEDKPYTNEADESTSTAKGLVFDGHYTWGSLSDARAWMSTPGLFLPVAGTDWHKIVYGVSYPSVGGYIPLLPAGVSGMLTGSKYALTDIGKNAPVPIIPIPTHGADLVGPLHEPVDNGAPFWRCDTFFLLRQTKIAKPIVQIDDTITAQTTLFSPMIENRRYTAKMETENSWGAQLGTNISDNTYGSFHRSRAYNQQWGPVQAGLMSTYANMGNISRQNFKEFQRKLPTSITSSATTTCRELISYGQMVHYGYCTAPTNLNITQGVYGPTLCFTQGVKYSHTGSWANQAIWIGDNGHHGGAGATPTQSEIQAGDAVPGQKTAGGNYPGLPDTVYAPLARTNRLGFGLTDFSNYFTDSIEYWGGASIITSPVYPSLSGSHPDWDDYGTFQRGGILSSSLPRIFSGSFKNANLSQVYPLHPGFAADQKKFPPIKFPSWLDAGLARDLNIQVRPGMTHNSSRIQTGEMYVTSSLCSFTILTASTVHRPLDRYGQWSADLPLVANIYERRLLNAGSFVLDAPIRITHPFSQGSQEIWTQTLPNPIPLRNMLELKNGDLSQFWGTAGGEPFTPGGSLTAGYGYGKLKPGNGGNKYEYENGAFSPVHNAPPTRWRLASTLEGVGWNGGIHDSGMPNPRNFVGAVTGGDPFGDVKITKPYEVGIALSPSNFEAGAVTLNRAAGVSEDPDQSMILNLPLPGEPIMTLSASYGSHKEDEALYVLMPGDKLILGCQPSMHGGNPGLPISTNLNIAKWGPYDYEASRIAGTVQLQTTSSINMETPYEPARAFTLKASQGTSKLILYGTLLRDNKPTFSSLDQNLTNNYVHGTIGNVPVTDQFLISTRNELRNSYLGTHVAGPEVSTMAGASSAMPTIGSTGLIRGMRVRSARNLFVTSSDNTNPNIVISNLHISGSIQRFVSLTSSEIFYDSLGMSIMGIWESDGLDSHGSPDYEGTYSFNADDTAGNPDMGLSANVWWGHAFPFENRYKDVHRLTSRSPMMGYTSQAYAGSTDVSTTISQIRLRLPADGYDNTFKADYVNDVNQASSDVYKNLSAVLFGFGKRAGPPASTSYPPAACGGVGEGTGTPAGGPPQGHGRPRRIC